MCKTRPTDLGGSLSDLGSVADLGVCQNAAQQVGSVPKTLTHPGVAVVAPITSSWPGARAVCGLHRLGLSSDFRRLIETRGSRPVFLVGEKRRSTDSTPACSRFQFSNPMAGLLASPKRQIDAA